MAILECRCVLAGLLELTCSWARVAENRGYGSDRSDNPPSSTFNVV